MHGIIGKMIAAPGKREELIALMLNAGSDMPGCLSYIVARDSMDENALWITEVWESRKAHSEALASPSVKQRIAACKHLIKGFAHRIETTPAGGQGLPA